MSQQPTVQQRVSRPQGSNGVSAEADTRLSTVFRKAMICEDLRPKTIKNYMDAVVQFVNFHSGLNPLEATVNHIRAFLFHLHFELKYAPRSYNTVYYGLKFFYKTFLPDVNLMENFKRKRVKDGNVDILARHEYEDMVRHTINLKHRAMLEVLYGTGIRLDECVNLTFDDIDRKQMIVRVMGKGEKLRYTLCPRRMLDSLADYYRAEKIKPEKYVFEGYKHSKMAPNSIEHAVRKAAARAGIKKKSPLIPCVIPLPLIFLKQTGVSMFFRNCWVMHG